MSEGISQRTHMHNPWTQTHTSMVMAKGQGVWTGYKWTKGEREKMGTSVIVSIIKMKLKKEKRRSHNKITDSEPVTILQSLNTAILLILKLVSPLYLPVP